MRDESDRDALTRFGAIATPATLGRAKAIEEMSAKASVGALGRAKAIEEMTANVRAGALGRANAIEEMTAKASVVGRAALEFAAQARAAGPQAAYAAELMGAAKKCRPLASSIAGLATSRASALGLLDDARAQMLESSLGIQHSESLAAVRKSALGIEDSESLTALRRAMLGIDVSGSIAAVQKSALGNRSAVVMAPVCNHTGEGIDPRSRS